jgi:hypothetical protein
MRFILPEGIVIDENGYVVGIRKKTMAKKQRGAAKVKRVMHEWRAGTLHSGSKKGPKVRGRRQAIAVALSEAGLSRRK